MSMKLVHYLRVRTLKQIFSGSIKVLPRLLPYRTFMTSLPRVYTRKLIHNVMKICRVSTRDGNLRLRLQKFTFTFTFTLPFDELPLSFYAKSQFWGEIRSSWRLLR